MYLFWEFSLRCIRRKNNIISVFCQSIFLWANKFKCFNVHSILIFRPCFLIFCSGRLDCVSYIEIFPHAFRNSYFLEPQYNLISTCVISATVINVTEKNKLSSKLTNPKYHETWSNRCNSCFVMLTALFCL